MTNCKISVKFIKNYFFIFEITVKKNLLFSVMTGLTEKIVKKILE